MNLNRDGQNKKASTERLPPRRHAITEENSPEETIRRMRLLPERAARLKEQLRVARETNAR
jgi:hypothetical protein